MVWICRACGRDTAVKFGKPASQHVCRWCGFDARNRPRRHKAQHFERYVNVFSEDAGPYLDETAEGQWVDDD